MGETFAFLQQTHIALPICMASVLGIALITRRRRTAILLAALLAIYLGALWLFGFDLTTIGAQPWGLATLVVVMISFFALAAIDGAWTCAYVALMPLINWSFAAVPTPAIPGWLGGGVFQPLAIVTGLVLVTRDFAQREIKHWIFAAMVAGLALSSLTSWITVVFASGAAFLISETVDWAVYTFTNRPLSQRVMISSLISAPLDQVVFLGLASFILPGIFAFGTIMTGIVSKLLGAWIVSRVMAHRERRDAAIPQVNPA